MALFTVGDFCYSFKFFDMAAEPIGRPGLSILRVNL
jgi:hypothetical protein